jgi:hypothetical protein
MYTEDAWMLYENGYYKCYRGNTCIAAFGSPEPVAAITRDINCSNLARGRPKRVFMHTYLHPRDIKPLFNECHLYYLARSAEAWSN